jgi:hypothetical protein
MVRRQGQYCFVPGSFNPTQKKKAEKNKTKQIMAGKKKTKKQKNKKTPQIKHREDGSRETRVRERPITSSKQV